MKIRYTVIALLVGALLVFPLFGCDDDAMKTREAAANEHAELLAGVTDKPLTDADVKAAEAQDKAAAKEAAEKKAAKEKAAKEKAAKEAAEKKAQEEAEAAQAAAQAQAQVEAEASEAEAEDAEARVQATSSPDLALSEDYRASFVHGDKGAAYQKYIVLHDTEGESDAAGVIDYWDSNGAGVAAHFIVNKDGTVVQCVPLDKITHHAGFGDTGHNALYGVEDESRDDKVGTVPIGDWAADYGMNSYSVGIEMVHVGGSGDYPEAQLEAVDAVIAYIDAYYGFESTIIDHKAWRSGNSDTSPEFASYLANYQDHRTHD